MSNLSKQNGEGRAGLSRSARVFTEAMADSARHSLGLRRQIAKRIAAVGILMRLKGVEEPELGFLAEAYARSLIGGIVALYLDRFGSEPRDRAKHLLLSAADAISDSLRSEEKPRGRRSAS